MFVGFKQFWPIFSVVCQEPRSTMPRSTVSNSKDSPSISTTLAVDILGAKDVPSKDKVRFLKQFDTKALPNELRSVLMNILEDFPKDSNGEIPDSSTQELFTRSLTLILQSCKEDKSLIPSTVRMFAKLSTLEENSNGGLDRAFGAFCRREALEVLDTDQSELARSIKALTENPTLADVTLNQGNFREEVMKSWVSLFKDNFPSSELISTIRRSGDRYDVYRALLSRAEDYYLLPDGTPKSQEPFSTTIRRFTAFLSAIWEIPTTRNLLSLHQRLQAKKRSERFWSEAPKCETPLYVQELIFGTGPSSTNYRTAMKALRPDVSQLAIDKRPYSGGQFARTIRRLHLLNNRNRPQARIAREGFPGTEGPLFTSGPYSPLQPSDIGGSSIGFQNEPGFVAQTVQELLGEVLCSTEGIKIRRNTTPIQHGDGTLSEYTPTYTVTLKRVSGDENETCEILTDRIISCGGAGENRRAVQLASPLAKVVYDQFRSVLVCPGLPTYAYPTELDEVLATADFPLRGVESVVLIAGGDEGKVKAYQLLRYLIQHGLGGIELDRVKTVYWVNQDAPTKEAFEECNRTIYNLISLEFPRANRPFADFRIVPIPGKVVDTGVDEQGMPGVQIEFPKELPEGFVQSKLPKFVSGDLYVDCSGLQVGSIEGIFDGGSSLAEPLPRERGEEENSGVPIALLMDTGQIELESGLEIEGIRDDGEKFFLQVQRGPKEEIVLEDSIFDDSFLTAASLGPLLQDLLDEMYCYTDSISRISFENVIEDETRVKEQQVPLIKKREGLRTVSEKQEVLFFPVSGVREPTNSGKLQALTLVFDERAEEREYVGTSPDNYNFVYNYVEDVSVLGSRAATTIRVEAYSGRSPSGRVQLSLLRKDGSQVTEAVNTDFTRSSLERARDPLEFLRGILQTRLNRNEKSDLYEDLLSSTAPREVLAVEPVTAAPDDSDVYFEGCRFRYLLYKFALPYDVPCNYLAVNLSYRVCESPAFKDSIETTVRVVLLKSEKRQDESATLFEKEFITPKDTLKSATPYNLFDLIDLPFETDTALKREESQGGEETPFEPKTSPRNGLDYTKFSTFLPFDGIRCLLSVYPVSDSNDPSREVTKLALTFEERADPFEFVADVSLTALNGGKISGNAELRRGESLTQIIDRMIPPTFLKPSEIKVLSFEFISDEENTTGGEIKNSATAVRENRSISQTSPIPIPVTGIINGEEVQIAEQLEGENIFILGPQSGITLTEAEKKRAGVDDIREQSVAAFIYSPKITSYAEREAGRIEAGRPGSTVSSLLQGSNMASLDSNFLDDSNVEGECQVEVPYQGDQFSPEEARTFRDLDPKDVVAFSLSRLLKGYSLLFPVESTDSLEMKLEVYFSEGLERFVFRSTYCGFSSGIEKPNSRIASYLGDLENCDDLLFPALRRLLTRPYVQGGRNSLEIIVPLLASESVSSSEPSFVEKSALKQLFSDKLGREVELSVPKMKRYVPSFKGIRFLWKKGRGVLPFP